MPDYGQNLALNVRTGAQEAANNEINDIKYAQQLRRENDAIAMAKNKLLLDDLEFQNGSNEYDSNIIKKENQQLISDLGRYVNENPDWATNPTKAANVKFYKQKYKTTPAVLRSAAWKQANEQYKKYLESALKEPTKYNLDQLKSFENNLNNYGKDVNGNWLPSDQVKPLVFTPPEELTDVDKLEREIGTSLEPQTYEKLNNGRDGSYIGYLSDAEALKQANGIYNNNRGTYDYKNKGKSQDQIVNEIAGRLKNYTPIKYDIGDRNPVADALAIEAGKQRMKAAVASPEANPYKIVVSDSNYIKTDPKELASTFGTNVPYYYSDASGKLIKEQGDDFNYDGTIFDKGYRNDGKYQKTGMKVTPGYVYKTLDWAEENGFLKSRKSDWFSMTDAVKPEFQDRVEIINGSPDKNGDSKKFVKLKVFNEVNSNLPQYGLKYNKQFATTKQREGLGIQESFGEQQLFKDEAGNLFVMDSQGNPVPYNK